MGGCGAVGHDARPRALVREPPTPAQTVRVRAGQGGAPENRSPGRSGHTPGHLIFTLSGDDRDIIFTGDAAKNRAEILSLTADMTYDPAVSQRLDAAHLGDLAPSPRQRPHPRTRHAEVLEAERPGTSASRQLRSWRGSANRSTGQSCSSSPPDVPSLKYGRTGKAHAEIRENADRKHGTRLLCTRARVGKRGWSGPVWPS